MRNLSELNFEIYELINEVKKNFRIEVENNHIIGTKNSSNPIINQ
jgi:hypothetical protein